MISLEKMVKKYNLSIRGVIHIGAHYGQEYTDYVFQGIQDVLFFEPLPSSYKKLLENAPNNDHVKTYNLALGNETGERMMYCAKMNEGQSNSLLEPYLHAIYSPAIAFDDREMVKIDKLDNIEFDRAKFNMINIDVQGFELEVFKGAIKTLKTIDIIYAEVNFEELYKECVLVKDLDAFLGKFGFIRILTDSKPKSWGDALYLKY
jgi:FkbM family methyltransferase